MKRLMLSVALATAFTGLAHAQSTGGSSATPADQTQLRTRQDEGGTVREPNYNAADPRNRRAEGNTGAAGARGSAASGGSATPADQTQLRTRQDEGGTVREPNYNAAEPRNRRAEGDTGRAGGDTGRARSRSMDSKDSSVGSGTGTSGGASGTGGSAGGSTGSSTGR